MLILRIWSVVVQQRLLESVLAKVLIYEQRHYGSQQHKHSHYYEEKDSVLACAVEHCHHYYSQYEAECLSNCHQISSDRSLIHRKCYLGTIEHKK
jgi:hypothetical protein